ncbi:MAG: hypothetical protein ABI241_10100 [Bacteroidia bacterium]
MFLILHCGATPSWYQIESPPSLASLLPYCHTSSKSSKLTLPLHAFSGAMM